MADFIGFSAYFRPFYAALIADRRSAQVLSYVSDGAAGAERGEGEEAQREDEVDQHQNMAPESWVNFAGSPAAEF